MRDAVASPGARWAALLGGAYPIEQRLPALSRPCAPAARLCREVLTR